MQVTDDLIRGVIQQVLTQMRNGQPPAAPGRNGHASQRGVFADVESAVAAAREAQKEFEARGLEDRRKAVACIRKICSEQAETLGREELEETKIGRLVHKIEKLKVIADRIPGVEFLRTDAFSGENGVSLQEYAPFGVIGVITPVTHSLPTLACNAINMLASGNALVCNPHPSGDTHRLQGRSSVQSSDFRGHRHRQSADDHRETDAGIGAGDLRSPGRPYVVRHRRSRCRPRRSAKSQARHRRRAGQSAGGRR